RAACRGYSGWTLGPWPTVCTASVEYGWSCSVQEDAQCSGGDDDVGFLDFEPPQQAECDQGDGGGDRVGDCLAGEDDDCAGECACCGGGGAGDEGADLWVVAVAQEPAAGDDDAEVDGGEDGDGRHDRPGQTSDEVADESGGDDDG